jgi:hypothetical protein
MKGGHWPPFLLSGNMTAYFMPMCWRRGLKSNGAPGIDGQAFKSFAFYVIVPAELVLKN